MRIVIGLFYIDASISFFLMSNEFGTEYQQQLAALEADKDAYTEAVDAAAVLATEYDGSEAKYEALIAALDVIEGFARKHAAVIIGDGLVQKEVNLAHKWQFTEVPLTVSDFLEVSSEVRNSKLAANVGALKWRTIDATILPPGKGAIRQTEGKSKFVEPKYEERLAELVDIFQEIGIFTDDLIVTQGKNQANMVRQEESYVIVEIPRLQRTVLVCNLVGEATFVIHGTISRQALTSLSKADLLAAYPGVVHPIVRHSYAYWKAELLKHLMSVEESIKPRSKNHIRPKETKIDVGAYDEMRELVKKNHTPESWVVLLKRSKMSDDKPAPYFLALSIGGYGLRAIYTRFGLPGNPFTKLNFLRLGLTIWGEDNTLLRTTFSDLLGGRDLVDVEMVESRTPDEWAAVIKNKYTPTQWVGLLEDRQLNQFEVDGKKIRALCRVFGVEFGTSRASAVLEIGKVVFNNDPVILKAIEISGRSLEDWSQAIKKSFTPTMWLELLKNDQPGDGQTEGQPLFCKTKIDGRNITWLCRKFEIVEQPWSIVAFLKLGLVVWGKEESDLKIALVEHAKKVPALLPKQGYTEEELAEISTRAAEQWRQIIKERYTVQQWFKVAEGARSKGWTDLEVDSKKLNALCTVFGINGRDKVYLDFLKLTVAIWGPADPVVAAEVQRLTDGKTIEEFEKISARSVEEWKIRIKELYTPVQWVAMANAKGVKSFAVDSKKITYMQSVFNLVPTQKPVVDFLNLGFRIWGETNPEILAALAKHRDNLTPDELKAVEARTTDDWKRILQVRFTPEQWVNMPAREGVPSFKVDGKRIRAVATLLGYGADDVYTIPGFLTVGLIVWPDDPLILTALRKVTHGISTEKRVEIKERTVEGWRARVRELFTPEQWVNTAIGRGKSKKIDMRDLIIDGKKIAALFGIFGVADAENRSSFQLLKLGLEIWGEENEFLKEAIIIESRTVEQWGEAIKKKYTVEDWLALANGKGVHQFEIDGRKISSILRMFGIKTSNRYSVVNFLTLGLRIWGEDQPLIREKLEEHSGTYHKYVLEKGRYVLEKGLSLEQLKEIETRTVADWTAIIKERFTPETWMSYAKNRKTAFELSVDTKKCTSLASIFGIQDKYKEANAIAKIGEIVWGADDPAIKMALENRLNELKKWGKLGLID